jgi:hypothetical protein
LSIASRCFRISASQRFRVSTSGSSLVTTLLVVTVLTIIVVAFMQSMSIERMTSRSYANIEQARLAAEAGVNAAAANLLTLFKTYPDSATAWQPIFIGGNRITEGTVFHFRGAPVTNSPSFSNLPTATSPSAFGANVTLYTLPLISGAQMTRSTNLDSTFSSSINSTTGINLNEQNWIGTAPGQPIKQFWAEWVEILRDPSQPRDLSIDPATGRPRNPPIARYAYWVEDESFKIDLSLASTGLVGTNTLTNAQQIPAATVLRSADPSANPTNLAARIALIRNQTPFSSVLQVAQTATDESGKAALATNLPFIATIWSSGYNMSRGGWQRVNVNALFTNLTASTANATRTALDRFITTVTNTNASPLFGQRFLREGSPSSPSFTNTINSQSFTSPSNAVIYLNKIAVNVKDYIDSDSQPTLVDRDTFAVRPAQEPTEALEPLGGGTEGPNPVIAFGKENVPMLQEYAVHARLLDMNPRGWSNTRGTASFRFTYDHYFEFWNMGTKDIYVTNAPPGAVELGPSAFLLLYNQPGFNNPNAFSPPSPAILEGRPIRVQLSSVTNSLGQPLVFPAGQPVVLTTDPKPNTTLLRPGANVYHLPVATNQREFFGTTRDSSNDKTKDSGGQDIFDNTYRVLLNGRSTSGSRHDYESCLLLGNANGILDSHCALPIVRNSSGNPYAMAINYETVDRLNSDGYFVRGGSLRGNSGLGAGPQPDTGDPRSLNEQLHMKIWESGSTPGQTRFYASNLDNNDVPADSTIGTLNTNFVFPNNWPDFSTNSSSSGSANFIVADAPMNSVGEFGNIYDPARVIGNLSTIERARGGGRTLKVGQSDAFSSASNRSGLWDGNQTSASRTWVAWRLADLFDTTSSWEKRGIFNPNGALRDNGLALSSLLEGFQFGAAPGTPTNLANITLSQAQISNFVSAVTNRIHGASTNSANNDLIFWERGELSELPLLSSGTTLSGQNLGQTIDRGREEVIRRLIQVVETKGNTFSIYSVGQAVTVKNGVVVPIATHRQRAVIKLDQPSPASNDNFNPQDAQEVTQRFAPATNFSIQEITTLP